MGKHEVILQIACFVLSFSFLTCHTRTSLFLFFLEDSYCILNESKHIQYNSISSREMNDEVDSVGNGNYAFEN